MRRTLSPETKTQLEQLFLDEGIDDAKGLAGKVVALLNGETPEEQPISPEARAAINPAMRAHCAAKGIKVESFARTWVRQWPNKTFTR